MFENDKQETRKSMTEQNGGKSTKQRKSTSQKSGRLGLPKLAMKV